MNILVLLIPKSQVEFVEDTFTIRQTIEKMSHHHYSAIPVINGKGEYVGTIKEGDLLWYIKENCDLNYKNAEHICIKEINRIKDNITINSRQTVEELLDLSMEQNFIPVVDDFNHFIGIVTRKSIIKYLIKNKN